MKVYEEQRIELDFGFLIARGQLKERTKDLDSKIAEDDKIIKKETKMYMNGIRECFKDVNTGEKLDKIIYHHFSANENLLIIFPVKADNENVYQQIFDEEKSLYYIEI